MRLTLFAISLCLCFFFVACRKAVLPVENTACILQTGNPHLKTYTADSVTAAGSHYKHCGLLPLSPAYQWFYEDSVFTTSGSFSSLQNDTLQFSPQYRTADDLVWWAGDKYIGLPGLLYANDSSLFSLDKQLFVVPEVMAARREYHFYPEDSVRYLTSFSDMGAVGKAIRQQSPVTTPAGSFSGCILYEKNAPGYRRERIWFMPGIGVVRFTQELAGSNGQLKLRRISVLSAYQLN